MLSGKHILLGVTGSIAAYKSAMLVRLLVKQGAHVRVILTEAAKDFVTPITLATLSKNPVYSDFIKSRESGEWVNHVELGKWADLMLIAPLSASTLSKLCSGNCDNLLLATYLSANCPIYVAPAMDLDMCKHWTTEKNFEILNSNGVQIIDSDEGELASGLIGKGRMAEVEQIVRKVSDHFQDGIALTNKRIIITAGPTHQPIDPVRFIGNYSSGKMGFALAEAAHAHGALVTLITGPTNLTAPDSIERVDIQTAQEMFNAVNERFEHCDALVMSAAVADYTPQTPFQTKQKKESGGMNSIALKPTIDILKAMGELKAHQKLIGFALETDDELANGKKKLADKNLDMLVLNSLNDAGAGFGTDTNKVTFISSTEIREMPLKSKQSVAIDIINELEKLF